MNNEQNTPTMNKVTTTKSYKGEYKMEVVTPTGAAYTFTLRNEYGMEYASKNEFWNLTTQDDVNMDCLSWWPSKKVCLRNMMQEIDFDYAASQYGA